MWLNLLFNLTVMSFCWIILLLWRNSQNHIPSFIPLLYHILPCWITIYPTFVFFNFHIHVWDLFESRVKLIDYKHIWITLGYCLIGYIASVRNLLICHSFICFKWITITFSLSWFHKLLRTCLDITIRNFQLTTDWKWTINKSSKFD